MRVEVGWWDLISRLLLLALILIVVVIVLAYQRARTPNAMLCGTWIVGATPPSNPVSIAPSGRSRTTTSIRLLGNSPRISRGSRQWAWPGDYRRRVID